MTLSELLNSLEIAGYTLLGTTDSLGTYGDDSLVKKAQLVYKISGNILHEQRFYMITKVDETEAWFFGGFDPTNIEVKQEITEYVDGLAKGFYATGVLTFSGQPNNGDTVTIDSKTYTFQTSLTDSDGNVKIGADAEESARNFVSAINLFVPGAGDHYAASMTVHPTVGALRNDNLVEVTAEERGTDGNSIVTTETGANLAFGGSTLDGGTAAIIEGYEIESIDYEYGWAIIKWYVTSGGKVNEDRYFIDKDGSGDWQYRTIQIAYT